ncbi:MAG: GCN5-related N-acetyltransferase [Marmoricola sp.]|nr:GCN5-related N-acetyltransferase [Marmoricola sp.]
MDGLTWPRSTARLVLRPALDEDLEALWQIRRQESVGTWLGDSSTVLDEFVTEAHEIDRLGSTLVIEHDGAIIGDLSARIGMRREAHSVKDSLHRTLGWSDGYIYAILAEEWRTARPTPGAPD